jgi:hypothetical protein
LETFSRKNVRCGIEESLRRIAPSSSAGGPPASGAGLCARLSLRRACLPLTGGLARRAFARARLRRVCARRHHRGGDAARRLVEATAHRVPLWRIAVYFHDTRGQALANILACLGLGVLSARSFGYCVFGEVVEGIDVVDQIRKVPTKSRGPHQDVPATSIVIGSATAAPDQFGKTDFSPNRRLTTAARTGGARDRPRRRERRGCRRA